MYKCCEAYGKRGKKKQKIEVEVVSDHNEKGICCNNPFELFVDHIAAQSEGILIWFFPFC